MLKNKIILISMLVLFILSIGFVSASTLDSDLNENAISEDIIDGVETEDIVSIESSEDLSSSSADTENLNIAEEDEVLTDNIKPSGNTFNDIQSAVDNAKDNDIIELNGSYISHGRTINVNKSLTFNGLEGATLDADNVSGIFHITKSVQVTFNNIKFTNALKGGIFADSEGYVDKNKINLVINNCNFVNNYNDYYGGAIYAFTSASCKITNSNFTGNYVKDPDYQAPMIGNSLGGAIHALNLDLTNCSFIKNNAETQGGAIYFEESANVTGCIFKDNFARDGGAIYSPINGLVGNMATKLSLKDSTFISNYLKNTDTTYTYNRLGGAVHSEKITVLNCIFKNNSATYVGGKGGAIYGSDIDVKNSVFEGNIANYVGGIYSDNALGVEKYTPGVLKITNCSFISNKEGAAKAMKTTIVSSNSVKTYQYKTLNNNLNPFKLLKATAKRLTTTYYSGKTIKVKVLTSPSNKPARRTWVLFIAKSSKKKYTIAKRTNYYGIATLKASNLQVGNYTVYVYETFYTNGKDPANRSDYKVPGYLKKTTLKVYKAKPTVKAPKVNFRYKQSKYFKVTLKHKISKKMMSGIKLKLRVYTGNRFKTYTVKTNKKGVANFNTKKLRRGLHRVKILSGNKNVYVSKTSSIRIR